MSADPMTMKGLQRIAELVERRRATHGLRAHPCTADEIGELEKKLGVRLPAAYREILLCDGHGGLQLLAGTDWAYQHVLEIQGWAGQMARRDGFPLGEHHLVIAMHQGYQFFFVDVEQGDDPPLMHYVEKSGSATQLSPTMTTGIAELIEPELDEDWRSFGGGDD